MNHPSTQLILPEVVDVLSPGCVNCNSTIPEPEELIEMLDDDVEEDDLTNILPLEII